ncbi:hydroxymethylglutaryl-coenzyme A reductase [Burkholderia alba]|uniref:hydroxymethylglutaryl-coenzyme A reductase n=1 Tax=Burkholderia alba TaxID=2683677 RepID=UPI003898EC73
MDHSSVFRAMMPGRDGDPAARIAVAHPDFAGRLPLVRLDRRGLVFRAHDALPPAYGLPRPATLFADDAPLCTLRLVIRRIDVLSDGQRDLTMQPSAADGDALFWHALRNHRQQRPADWPLALAGCGGAVPALPAADGMPARPAEIGMRLSRTAAFRLADRSDALFFADWLEYHFDELRALAQQKSPRLHLNQLERRLTGDEVGVRFVYDIDGHADRDMLTDCARQACDWIETEMLRRFDLPIAQERFGSYQLHRAGSGGEPAYSFSSK